MSKILKITTIIIFFSVNLYSQNIRNLSVFKTDFFDSKASITVEALRYDPVLAADALKNALVMNSFRVISERVAKSKVEIKNQGKIKDSTFDQDISIGKTTYLKSVYIITLNYNSRSDTGCGGRVMSDLSGQVIDLSNDGQIVATFSFKQGAFGGKCTQDIMMALARKLK